MKHPPVRRIPLGRRLFVPWLLVLLLVGGDARAATQVKPGWNLFSPQQDVQMGQEAAKDIEKQVQVVNDKKLNQYVTNIGQRLAKHAQGEKYPYTFKVVADPSINAFALPGGPTYVHTGLIAAADNEAQLAGVMAHEIAHVALRHSTNQVTKAYAFQLPLMLAGGLLDKSGGIMGTLANLGVSFGLNSLFMKYSRDAEKQADLLGAQMMAEAGYEPIEMARFFEKLEGQGGSGGRMPQFFSDHPNPGNRVKYVSEEVATLPKRNYTKGSSQFNDIKKRAAGIKAPAKKAQGSLVEAGTTASGTPSAPGTGGYQRIEGRGYELSFPTGWKAYSANEGAALTIAPENGILRQSNGTPAMARGVMAGYFESSARGVSERTDQLIADLQSSNPDMQAVRGQRQKTTVSGQAGESALLQGTSPLPNQKEMVWLVTSERPNGLFYMVMVAPESEYSALRKQYEQIVSSVRFR